MLELNNIRYTYDKTFKIENISFTLGKGETLAIVGPSGSGKTTLLKLILGSLEPDEGLINLDSINITNLNIDKRNIGYCPQDQLLFPHLNVFDNIAMGLKAKHLPKREIIEQVEKLAQMSDINFILKRKTNQISGGQKQRVSILRALATNPKILLLDEPFHNLDAQIKGQIVNYIKKVQSLLNIGIIFVTHDITEAKLLADKILILIDGQMKQVGSSRELSYNPNSYEVAKAMGIPNIFEIQSHNEEKNIIKLEIGEIKLEEIKYKGQKNVLIDPTGIILDSKKEADYGIFQGLIKGILYDLLTQKQILEVQIIENNPSKEEKEIAGLQITLDSEEFKLEKNQKIEFNIPSESLKFF